MCAYGRPTFPSPTLTMTLMEARKRSLAGMCGLRFREMGFPVVCSPHVDDDFFRSTWRASDEGSASLL